MNVRPFLSAFISFIGLAVSLFWISREVRKSNQTNSKRLEDLERARQAKLAKSILKKSNTEENEESITV